MYTFEINNDITFALIKKKIKKTKQGNRKPKICTATVFQGCRPSKSLFGKRKVFRWKVIYLFNIKLFPNHTFIQ